ncbi:hypothetical protein M409DRAFT_21225 [Zasmidium cellare ATCC 36951]|uniref:NACHT-NTPase and P-loop NTPases N-terminal domain-containing protein n=1 Tax=Zasmidium cellare ATCC 36951 TaxID=1080233 RepID=A0A6A6CSN0_ZASCE|nr:uncharacterized protein M409DRAFT_21225 [Zasmidium cellare ATCC 36951]KAF2168476.1 hypothetical protein M409DRAFT_21225 [Zasmidium cellare ATCC 36951]
MAEVGAVASVAGLISLGLQLAECAVKLKRFCDQVEKAPEALRTLEIEIKLFSLLLQDVEAFRIQRAITPSPSLLQCIYHCQIVAAKIVNYVQDIEGISKKYKLPGRVYTALRLSDVNALCRNMERTKTNLIIALQLLSVGFPAASINSNPTALTQAMHTGYSQHPAGSSELLGGVVGEGEEQHESHTETQLARHNRQPVPATKGHSRKFTSSKRVFRLQVWLPWLLGQAVWDFSLRRSYRGWEMCFQCDNIIPDDSLVFYYVLKGDTMAVQRLFREGKASPYDSKINAWVHVERLCFLEDGAASLSDEMYSTILSHMAMRDRALTAEMIAGYRRFYHYFVEREVDHSGGFFNELVELYEIDILDQSWTLLYTLWWLIHLSCSETWTNLIIIGLVQTGWKASLK